MSHNLLLQAKVACWANALVLVRLDCNLASTCRYKLVASRSVALTWHGACYSSLCSGPADWENGLDATASSTDCLLCFCLHVLTIQSNATANAPLNGLHTNSGGDTLCAALYTEGCGGWALFAGGTRGDLLYAGGCRGWAHLEQPVDRQA